MHGDRRSDSLVLFVAGTFILATGSFWGLPSGRGVVGGLVILDGGVPYRDFWTMYAPGQFYSVAALYWLFGRELLVQAIAVSLVCAASAVTFFVLLRRLGAPRQPALCLSAVFVLMFWTTGPELTDYPAALLFLLLALDRIVRYCGGSGTGHLRWAGLWIGLAAWFKHDVAAYVAVGTTISLFVSWLVVGEKRPAGWQAPLRATLTIATFALAAAAPVAIWTAWSAGADAWNDLFVFPATVFSKVRGDQFPPLIPNVEPVFRWLSDVTNERKALAAAEGLSTWVLLNAPQFTFLGGVSVLLATKRRFQAASIAHLALFLACMPFFWAAAHIQHNTHPYTMAILGSGVGVVVWPWTSGPTRWKRVLRGPVMVAVAVYAAALLVTPGVKGSLIFYEWAGSRVLNLTGLRGVRLPARLYDSFQPVGQFFRTHTRESEPIYTGLLRHDSIVINNTLLYAIAGRPACCGYTELHPGVGDRAPVQREIIRRLEDTRVRAIALWEFGWPESVMEARKQHTVAGVPDAGSILLDRYIAENFRLIESHGEYHVFWRRDAPFAGHQASVESKVGLSR